MSATNCSRASGLSCSSRARASAASKGCRYLASCRRSTRARASTNPLAGNCSSSSSMRHDCGNSSIVAGGSLSIEAAGGAGGWRSGTVQGTPSCFGDCGIGCASRATGILKLFWTGGHAFDSLGSGGSPMGERAARNTASPYPSAMLKIPTMSTNSSKARSPHATCVVPKGRSQSESMQRAPHHVRLLPKLETSGFFGIADKNASTPISGSAPDPVRSGTIQKDTPIRR